ncbi:MAG: ABC transporter ATP-binding protein [Candidatus Zixiibacteriota bacterium]|nr:MAG: ABC transporter ATP-binding protein [candidate division Zixibacteria bacterium]
MIRIESLHKSFNSHVVLDGITLDIHKGQSLAIIGQSGCGKSVLLKHLIRLISPDTGRVLVDGRDLEAMSYQELVATRQRFGMLFQSAALFDSLTIEENVGLGLAECRQCTPEVVHETAMQMLDMVGLASAADKYPSEISGGMKKRAGLARAIANHPEVLLCDEPTSGLDPVTADLIDALIVDLDKRLNTTSIVVTHDMRSAYRVADRIVMLYNGKIQFDGTPDEIRATNDDIVQQFIQGKAEGPIQVR